MSDGARAAGPAPDRLMQVGELAQLTGLSHRTLRFYEEAGLLTPTTRSSANYRLYSQTDLQRLLVIRRMKPLGYSIAEMRHLLDLVEDTTAEGGRRGDVDAELDAFLESAQQRRDRLQRHLSWADDFIAMVRGLRTP